MEKVKVVIRIRPNISKDDSSKISTDGNSIVINQNLKKYRCNFDKILNQNSSQKDVFNFIKPSLKKVEEGFNCSILAYGQTGSGKTYTMFGSDWSYNQSTSEKILQKDENNFILNKDLIIDPFSKNNGIIPNLILSIFQKLDENIFEFSISYIHIYNERIYDLLTGENETQKKKKFDLIKNNNLNENQIINQSSLKIKYDKVNGVIIENAKEIKTPSFYEMFELLKLGEINKKIRHTNKNEMSSRSHTIFIINIFNKNNGVKNKIKLCDLAGSERYDSNEKYEKNHFKELCNINKSLSILGKVINQLSQKKKQNYISFKDSKLTQILEDSLGGNSSTYLIATISIDNENFDETVNTLKFANRAHNIFTQIKKIEINKNNEYYLKLCKEYNELKELLTIREKNGTLNPIHLELYKLKKENKQLQKIIENKNIVTSNDEDKLFIQKRQSISLQKLAQENKQLKKKLNILSTINKLENNVNENQSIIIDKDDILISGKLSRNKSRNKSLSKLSCFTNRSKNNGSALPLIGKSGSLSNNNNNSANNVKKNITISKSNANFSPMDLDFINDKSRVNKHCYFPSSFNLNSLNLQDKFKKIEKRNLKRNNNHFKSNSMNGKDYIPDNIKKQLNINNVSTNKELLCFDNNKKEKILGYLFTDTSKHNSKRVITDSSTEKKNDKATLRKYFLGNKTESAYKLK